MTGVDFSDVALANARRLAGERGVGVEWVDGDLRDWQPPAEYDLVAVLYLQVPADERRVVLSRAVGALAPGGTLLVVGHHSDNIEHGSGGPKDPRVLYSAEDVAADLDGLETREGRGRAASGRGRAGRDRRAGPRSPGCLVRHRPLDVTDVEQADLALVDRGERVGDERVEARLVDLDVEDAAAAGGHGDRLHVVQRVGRGSCRRTGRRVFRIVPTMWKSVSSDGPASTTQKRTRSPGSAVSGCLTYWPEYPLNVIQSGCRAWALSWLYCAGSLRPSELRYHSLATST